MERIYLDYNATSPLSPSVINWLKSGEVVFANPSSQHTLGKESRKIINQTRSKLYSTFGLTEDEFKLFFHSGATEGISTFAHSFSAWAKSTGRDLLICYSELDHPAVLGLGKNDFGSHVSFYHLKMTADLEYNHLENSQFLNDIKKQRPNLIILYHHLWVHNETGLVTPLEELNQFKQIPDLFLHVDAVQAPGKIVNWKELKNGDIFTFSAHKFGAMKGIGFTFFRNKIIFSSFISGGGQQQGLRSGTENTLGIHSISLAIDDLNKVDIVTSDECREEIETHLAQCLQMKGGILSSRARFRNSNTIYFYLNQHASDVTLALFDIHGLMISAGSACSSGSAKESQVMLQSGLLDQARNGLRLSLPFKLSGEEIDLIKKKMTEVISKL